MNTPKAKLTMPVIPKVSETPRATIPYSVPTIAPLRSCPRISWPIDLLGLDVGGSDDATLLHVHHVEAEDRFTGAVVAYVPDPVVGEGHQFLLHLRHVVHRTGALHRLDQHVNVVVAGGGAQRGLIVGKLALVEVLVRGDELLDLGLRLFRF